MSFTIRGVHGGLTTVTGLITLKEQSLELEFESADAIIGFVKSDLKTISVPFSSIRRFDYESKFLRGNKFILQVKSMSAIKDVPGSKSGKVELYIDKPNKEDALALVSKFKMDFSEFRLGELDE
ncbi:MAG: hypothetical protein LAT57_13345 [Balneolales bacterium]|nr:hypothetical protein [Balneolales bacterium]